MKKLILLLLFPLSITAQKTALYRDSLRARYSSRITYYSDLDQLELNQNFTAPQPIRSRMTEWDTCGFLLLALSHDVFEDSLVEQYYTDIIRAAVRVTCVKVLINETDLKSQAKFIRMLRRENLGSYLNSTDTGRNSIEMILAKFDTKWIRDYGPMVAYNDNNELCLLDAIYYEKNPLLDKIIRTTTMSSDSTTEGENDNRPANLRHFDDAISIYLSSYFTATSDENINLVQPPLQLWGGDYQCDSKGNVFTSNNTLLDNGGVKNQVNTLFKDYYGAQSVTYLYPLPGPTIKHIDMFFKLVNDTTVLLGDYRDDADTVFREDDSATYFHTYVKFVKNDANRVLDMDSVILQKRFPYLHIIRVPMPQMVITNEYEDRCLDKIHEWSKLLALASPDSSFQKYSASQDSVKLPDDFLDYDTAIIRMKIEDLYDLLDVIRNTPQLATYVYRTYLNSTFINGATGQIILVPRYKDVTAMEPEIERIYRSVYPNASIVFVDSDHIISTYGAIHCTTLLFPQRR